VIRIDVDRTDLREAFAAAPFGPYSPDLQELLLHFRSYSADGRWVIVTLEHKKRYCLARLPQGRFDPPELDESQFFASPVEAEIALFNRRWDAAVKAQGS
jgi:hypothetical protein